MVDWMNQITKIRFAVSEIQDEATRKALNDILDYIERKGA